MLFAVGMQAPDPALLVSEILNACWMVRHYARGGQSSIQRDKRQQAVEQLGLVCRKAFAVTNDFEPILTAIVDGLTPEKPKF